MSTLKVNKIVDLTGKDYLTIQSIARSLNVKDDEVQFTDYTGVLDNVKYLHDKDTQITYGVPTLTTTGETIVSVSGSELTTSTAEVYGLYSVIKLTAENIEHLKRLNPGEGVIVETKGYYECGDGGHGLYINLGNSSGLTADGYVTFLSDSGDFLQPIPVNGCITDKSSGVVGDGLTDDTKAYTALLDYCNDNNLKAVLLSDEILTDQYKNTDISSLVLSPVGKTKITLRSDGQFLIWLANNEGGDTTTRGQFITEGPIEFDGNQFGPSIDGGLLQLNRLEYMELNAPNWHGFKNTSGFVPDGLATIGEGRLVLNNPQAGDCGAQLLYAQNSGGVTVNNPWFGESESHGIAHVNSGKFEVIGGKVNTVNGYGILTYSTESYRGDFADLSIVGTDLRNNTKPFEISRRYESTAVSNSDMNILLKDIDCRDCTDNATIGNSATDNVDGFTVRDMTIDGIKTNSYIEVFNTKVLRIKNMYRKDGESAVRLRNKVEQLYIDDSEVIGTGNVSNSNTVVYLYATAEVNDVFVNNVKSDGVYSLIYAESGATFNGKFTYTNYENNNPVAGFFLCNSNAYNQVGFDRGNRPDRNMAQQSWSADGSCPFYSTTDKKLLYWDGANIYDAAGTLFS